MEFTPLNKIRIFYDGDCGLCHRFVVFTLHNMQKDRFVFSPQNGPTFKKYENRIKRAGETIIIYNEKEDFFLYKGAAVRYVLFYFKWPWKIFAYILTCFPSIILDFLYDCIAKVRHKFFQKPKSSCPILPKKWMKYFED